MGAFVPSVLLALRWPPSWYMSFHKDRHWVNALVKSRGFLLFLDDGQIKSDGSAVPRHSHNVHGRSTLLSFRSLHEELVDQVNGWSPRGNRSEELVRSPGRQVSVGKPIKVVVLVKAGRPLDNGSRVEGPAAFSVQGR